MILKLESKIDFLANLDKIVFFFFDNIQIKFLEYKEKQMAMEKVEFMFNGESVEYEINIDKDMAETRKLWCQFYMNIVINNAPPTAKKGYITSINLFIRKAFQDGLVSKELDFFSLGRDSVELITQIKEACKADNKWKNINSKINNFAPYAFLNNYYIDFIENFKQPKIFWLNVSPNDDYWKNNLPLNEWKMGNNEDKIIYNLDNIESVEKDDIAIFYNSGKGVKHIGKVYKIVNNGVYFTIIIESKQFISLQDINKIDGIANYPPTYSYTHMKNEKEAAGIKLILKCLEDEVADINTKGDRMEKK